MTIFEIWMEGFECTGNYCKASHVSSVEADSFSEACDKYAIANPKWAVHYDSKQLSWWGCKLFDNEFEARRNFG